MNVQLRSEHSQPYSLYESSCQPGLSQSLTPLNLVNERSDSYKAILTVLHSVVYFFLVSFCWNLKGIQMISRSLYPNYDYFWPKHGSVIISHFPVF